MKMSLRSAVTENGVGCKSLHGHCAVRQSDRWHGPGRKGPTRKPDTTAPWLGYCRTKPEPACSRPILYASRLVHHELRRHTKTPQFTDEMSRSRPPSLAQRPSIWTPKVDDRSMRPMQSEARHAEAGSCGQELPVTFCLAGSPHPRGKHAKAVSSCCLTFAHSFRPDGSLSPRSAKTTRFPCQVDLSTVAHQMHRHCA